jgi:hypothetical protein
MTLSFKTSSKMYYGGAEVEAGGGDGEIRGDRLIDRIFILTKFKKRTYFLYMNYKS